MTRLQTALLLVLVALGSLLLGRAVWSVLAPVAASGAGALAHALRSVPEAAWWIALSAVWWVPCALGTRSGCRSSCSISSAASTHV
ncbi:MAG: hypothetical protein AAF845_17775 [Bacteroidota bacterium]